jgi:hypothetical protein
MEGWPEKTQLNGEVKPYVPVMTELSINEGLLLRGNRLRSLQPEILKKLHSGH